MDLPDLPTDDGSAKQSIVSASSGNQFNDGKENLGNGIWEDEDARKFYEDLPDLRILVPDVFLDYQQSTNEKKEEEVEETPEETEESPIDIEEEDLDTSEMDPSELVDEVVGEEGEDNKPTTQNIQLDGLFARLPTCGNRDLIDSVAVDFCYMNSKNARKRLVKTLLGVQRQRTDLLPYYSRLIATLNNYFSDIGEMVLAAVREENEMGYTFLLTLFL